MVFKKFSVWYPQALHTERINLSPFTKDFRVWEAPIETISIYLRVFLRGNLLICHSFIKQILSWSVFCVSVVSSITICSNFRQEQNGLNCINSFFFILLCCMQKVTKNVGVIEYCRYLHTEYICFWILISNSQEMTLPFWKTVVGNILRTLFDIFCLWFSSSC